MIMWHFAIGSDTEYQWLSLRGGARSGGGLRHRVLPQALPLAWRQLQHKSRRMCRDPLDDIAQVDEGIGLQVLARLHQRTQEGGPVRCRFATGKQIIWPVQNKRL